MNREAIFSDGTEAFRMPVEPEAGDKVTIRLRVAHDDKVTCYLCTKNNRTIMHPDEQNDVFDYYRSVIYLGTDVFEYYYAIEAENEICYFDRFGLSEEIRWQYHFSIMPGFDVPEWSKGAVMYQILVDRFSNGDHTNDVLDDEYFYISGHSHQVKTWSELPKDFDVKNFYGGDIEGVRQKLYYLKSIGVEVIYFNPIFVSPSNHKYDIQDYDFIDPHYGKIVLDEGDLLPEGDNDNKHATRYIKRVTARENLEASNALFADFVREAHQKGIRVILDGVFNHCGSFNKWLDRERIYENQPGYPPGAYVSKDSPYHDFFRFYEDGSWPYNGAYDGWWGHDTLPKLNYESSRELKDYILRIGAKWVSPPYNVDGWRLDVAADLGHSEEFNHHFWREFPRAVKEANPDAIVLAEHYGDARAWLSGDQWDTVMNYDAFMEPVSYFFTGMEKHSDSYDEDALGNGKRFELTMRHCMTAFMTSSLHCAMNQLSNHDHSRFLTRTNHKVGRVAQLGSNAAGEDVSTAIFKEAVLMQMTWPGAPTLYYGDEAGQVGFTDPDNRRTFPWRTADYELIDFHRDTIFMHRIHEALRIGSFMFLETGRFFVSYARFTEDEQIVVLINSGNDLIQTVVPVWQANVPMNCIMKQILITTPQGYSIMPVDYAVEGGRVTVKLQPQTAIVLANI